MSSYTSLIAEFEGVFADTAWISQDVPPAFPTNFSLTEDRPSEYIVLECLPSQPLMNQYGGSSQVAGLFIVQIYTPINVGSRRVYEVADMLDAVLNKQMVNYNIQTESSSLDPKGSDSSNPSLYRADYSVRFNSY